MDQKCFSKQCYFINWSIQGLQSLYTVSAACTQWKIGRGKKFFLMRVFTEIYDSLWCNIQSSFPSRNSSVIFISYMFKAFKLLCFVLAIMICLKCKTFDQLFLRKVIKTDAIRCLHFHSKSTKMRLAARLRSQCSTSPPSWIQGVLLLRVKEGGMDSILYPDLGG